jgi:hypothetical protein
MMRLALAAAALVLTAAAHVPLAPRRTAEPAKVVRAQIVSGTPQTARAYVSPSESKYVTEFPALLVVAVNVADRVGKKRRVRFHCETKNCALAAAEQLDNGREVHLLPDDVSTKDADIVKGRASIRIAVEADRPDATYTVTATPIVRKGERAVPVSFRLTSR